MSSQEASLVNLSLTPGGEEARKMTATSGRSLSALLPKCGPLGSLVKMLLESQRWSSQARLLFWEAKPLYSRRTTLFTDTDTTNPSPLNASAQTLNSSDMQSNRCLFRLVPSEPPTEETGSSLSPILKTPCTFDAQSERMKSASIPGSSGTLAQEIQNGMAAKRGLLLPTPLVVEREHPERVEALKNMGATRMNSRANGEQRPNGIIDFMNFYNLLPTPRSNTVNGCDLNNEKLAERNKWNLEEVVAKMNIAMKEKYGGLMPTPTSTEWKGTFSPETVESHNRDFLLRSLPTVIGVYKKNTDGGTSQLSPLFTEEMMGFPLMWTALPFLSESGAPKPSKPTATPSSPK